MTRLRHGVQGERERCLELVKGYREQIEIAIANPKYKKVERNMLDIGEAVARSLRRIEDQIAHPEQYSPRGTGPDFSMEEIEKSEAIMAEQNQNPFEDVS
jgi:hypothetical protein